ncbi:MAG: hypothetical protein AB7P14_13080 [Blastocatellales bacterium]
MSNQLIADMNSMMVALQIAVTIISAIAIGALAVYLIGIFMLCLGESKNSRVARAGFKPATVYRSDKKAGIRAIREVSSSVRSHSAIRF